MRAISGVVIVIGFAVLLLSKQAPVTEEQRLGKRHFPQREPERITRSTNFPFHGACTPSSPCSESSVRVVPNRVHYVWFHKAPEELLFYQYLSMLSVIRFHGPEEIWFWHNTLPKGNYWQNITATIETRNIKLRLKLVESHKNVFNITVAWMEHASDIQRLLALMQYGGIYLDFDVVVLKRLSPLMCHTAVIGQAAPTRLCNSFIMSSADAPFLRLWYESYRSFVPITWDSHNALSPYKISSSRPDLVHVEKECMQHPNWEEEERKRLFGNKDNFNWSSNYVIHGWNVITYETLRNVSPKSITNDNSSLSEIYRYIYYGS